jgi:hypothetical protein
MAGTITDYQGNPINVGGSVDIQQLLTSGIPIAKINNVQIYAPQNVLSGKLYCACGDSFTYGDFSGEDGSTDTGESAWNEYNHDYDWGCNKTYPYWIAKRNGMILNNIAQNGATLQNFVAYARYNNIPLNADYVTIKFGINDSHNNRPIGTIDDNTSDTFMGCWNVLLAWLITNRPNAKIGVIASNGCDAETYSTATAQVCKKYGVMCLDEEHDDNVPFFFRQEFKASTNGVPASIKTLLYTRYAVNYNGVHGGRTNNHPNVEAYIYESTFVEAFLRSL